MLNKHKDALIADKALIDMLYESSKELSGKTPVKNTLEAILGNMVHENNSYIEETTDLIITIRHLTTALIAHNRRSESLFASLNNMMPIKYISTLNVKSKNYKLDFDQLQQEVDVAYADALHYETQLVEQNKTVDALLKLTSFGVTNPTITTELKIAKAISAAITNHLDTYKTLNNQYEGIVARYNKCLNLT